MRLYLILIFFIFSIRIFSSILTDSIPETYKDKIMSLIKDLAELNVPESWVIENINHKNFTIYQNIKTYYDRMLENRHKNKEITLEQYFRIFDVENKINKARVFIEKNRENLLKVESKNGIPKELIVAILAIETDLCNPVFKGKFYTFPALVSHYVLMDNKKKFAINELYNLYRFQQKYNIDTYYFVGSFAGAVGWGQFIPSSLWHFFLVENKEDSLFDYWNTFISIENYFYLNGFNKNSSLDEDNIKKLIYKYNRSYAYVEAVYYIYKNLF